MSNFTKKHYEKIALLFYSQGCATKQEEEILKIFAKRTAIMFENDNPRFDRRIFIRACGFREDD